MDLRVLKAAMEGDMIAMRELHGLCPKRLKAAHNKVLAMYYQALHKGGGVVWSYEPPSRL